MVMIVFHNVRHLEMGIILRIWKQRVALPIAGLTMMIIIIMIIIIMMIIAQVVPVGFVLLPS